MSMVTNSVEAENAVTEDAGIGYPPHTRPLCSHQREANAAGGGRYGLATRVVPGREWGTDLATVQGSPQAMRLGCSPLIPNPETTRVVPGREWLTGSPQAMRLGCSPLIPNPETTRVVPGREWGPVCVGRNLSTYRRYVNLWLEFTTLGPRVYRGVLSPSTEARVLSSPPKTLSPLVWSQDGNGERRSHQRDCGTGRKLTRMYPGYGRSTVTLYPVSLRQDRTRRRPDMALTRLNPIRAEGRLLRHHCVEFTTLRERACVRRVGSIQHAYTRGSRPGFGRQLERVEIGQIERREHARGVGLPDLRERQTVLSMIQQTNSPDMLSHYLADFYSFQPPPEACHYQRICSEPNVLRQAGSVVRPGTAEGRRREGVGFEAGRPGGGYSPYPRRKAWWRLCTIRTPEGLVEATVRTPVGRPDGGYSPYPRRPGGGYSPYPRRKAWWRLRADGDSGTAEGRRREGVVFEAGLLGALTTRRRAERAGGWHRDLAFHLSHSREQSSCNGYIKTFPNEIAWERNEIRGNESERVTRITTTQVKRGHW
ncbi:hypothetical protein Bbelb_296420 [Branchiostoma belcheri]|nr:hypothetical protein Bbelb_296420 [Branchiostoma belcheri]